MPSSTYALDLPKNSLESLLRTDKQNHCLNLNVKNSLFEPVSTGNVQLEISICTELSLQIFRMQNNHKNSCSLESIELPLFLI